MMEVVEVDEHHHVVPSLVMQGPEGCLVLFDSHDDLGVPPRFSPLPRARAPGGLARATHDGELDIGTWCVSPCTPPTRDRLRKMTSRP